MIPEFFQSPEQTSHFGAWQTIVGLLIVLIGTFVGVEIKLGNDDDET